MNIQSDLTLYIKCELTHGGLPAMESMATKLPNILPNNAAFGEWAHGSSVLYECDNIFAQVNQLNTIHLVPSKDAAIQALHMLYTDAALRKEVGAAGYKLVQEPQYRWEHIANEFAKVMLHPDKAGKYEGHYSKYAR